MNPNLADFYKAYMAYVATQDKAVIALFLATLGILSTWQVSSVMTKKVAGFVSYLFWAYAFCMPFFAILIYAILLINLWGSL